MKKRKITSEQIFLAAIILFAAFLRIYKLAQEGFGNLYYAAAVKSMLISFKNFFYAAFDPGGFISVDKPPVGLWLECLSAAIFGYKGWNLILPQAIAGVLSVWLIYHLIRRFFDHRAGLLAALFLAITPIFVATNRSNIVDSSLILVLLIAVWLLFKAIERKSLLFLLLSVAAVGIGFNIKMLQAYMILPAVYLTYLLFAKAGWRRKIFHLSIATVVLVAVSLSWAFVVDLTPKDERPIVSNSKNNSVLDLIIGYNAMMRFSPKEKPPVPRGMPQPPFSSELPAHPPKFGRASDMIAPPPPMPPSHLTPMMETGGAGIFRLLNRQLSGQISWFSPIILLGLFLWLRNLKLSPSSNSIQQVFFWLCWLLPSVLYFSFTRGLFHRYYLSMLAPPVAALAGIALTDLWREYRSTHKWSGWLLPVVFLLNIIIQVRIMLYFDNWNIWLIPIIIILNLTGFVTLIIILIKKIMLNRILKNTLSCFGITAITLMPLVWAITPIAYGGDVNLPYAGPDLVKNERFLPGYSPGRYNEQETEKLVRYLKENRQGEKYLVAVPSSILYGSKLVIQTGEPIITLGGFNGRDETITVRQLEQMVKNGEVRFFLIQKRPPFMRAPMPKAPGMPNENLRSIFQWVAQNGERIPPEKWRGNSPMMQQLLLYKCE